MNRGLRQKFACFFGLFIATACSDGSHENTSDSQTALQTGQPGVMSPIVAPTREPNGAIGAACGINVTRQSDSSPLITTPKIYFLYWGSYWTSGTGQSEQTSYTDTWSSMAGNEAFYKQLAEYGIQTGQYLGSSVQTPNLGTSGTVTEATVQSLLVGEIGSNGVPSNDDNTLFIIMMPSGTRSSYDSGLLGHHGFTSKNSANVWYAVIEYSSSANTQNEVISHEVYEAVTDPNEGPGANGNGVYGTGWRDPSQGNGDEVGDLCNLQTQTLRGVVIQKVWSQTLCGCLGAPTTVLEHIGLRSDGNLWHTIRLPTGVWDSYADTGFFADDVEMQNVGGNATQVIAISSGNMYHTIRNQDGSWTGWGDASAAMGTAQGVSHLGMGDVSSDMHVCAVGTDGVLYHGIRYSDGSWSTLNDTRGVLGNPEPMAGADCAGFGSTLQVVASTASGALYHGIRNSDGSWQGLNLLSSDINGRPVGSVAVANVANELHVLAITDPTTSSATLYHRIRYSDGSWSDWGIPPGSGQYQDVSAGEVNGELQVVTVATGGGDTFHTVRHSDGSWTAFGNIKGVAGDPGSISFVTATGSPSVTW